MFKKSSTSLQPTLFSSSSSLLSGKSLKIYEDTNAWHNLFREQITMRIDESIFTCLYNSNIGSPNASIRVLIAMMILKEAQGLSDEKLFENSRYNLLMRSALGLVNIDDELPTESTYYLFRKKVSDYAKLGNPNLFDIVFSSLTTSQKMEFKVSGKDIRMDSKLLGSNIAWLSRYELIHQTFRVFYREITTEEKKLLTTLISDDLAKSLHQKGDKIVYRHTTDEVKTKLVELGALIHKVLETIPPSNQEAYLTLKRVFEEQFKLNEEKIVVARDKEGISSKSVQSPHDTDAHFRNKDGNKVKGYAINLTESCNDEQKLNLIGDVEVKEVTTSDTEFFQEAVNNTKKVFAETPKNIHVDGAYHSPENQEFCSDIGANLYLHAIQGAKGRYELEYTQNDELIVLDTQTNETLPVTKIKSKKGEEKWRIKTDKGYRYFSLQDIETSRLRKKIAQTPAKVLQKRNNVEATIFQLGYHYSNNKSRYRGLVKHQMWANLRCLWVNFVRILKFIQNNGLTTDIFQNNSLIRLCMQQIALVEGFLKQKNNRQYKLPQKIRFFA